MNIDFALIKLVIWDLDNTFWDGIISEESITPIKQNIDLVKILTDCGVINSICSKNDKDNCLRKLEDLGVSDYFVFSSINWMSKGHRVKELISDMGLRPENVLFIDDDVVNIEEVKYYSPSILTAYPKDINELYNYFINQTPKDKGHDRLNQYKVLEFKNREQKTFSSNEEFLYSSNIVVSINFDCFNEIDRIYELIQRTNQLNYTKKRISLEDLSSLLSSNDYSCAYVTVRDKFGDYGIVGFYAIKNRDLEHFLFSCRTIGQGIEQYVYSKLDYPKINVQGDVLSPLDNYSLPLWINQAIDESAINTDIADGENFDSTSKVLVKGPCDLSKAMTYIKHSNLFDIEFTYVNEKLGNIIEAYNHSLFILNSKVLSENVQQEIVEDCIFFDPKTFTKSFFETKYNVIFLSTLNESYGIYRKKGTNICIAFGDHRYPLTNQANWNDYINGKIYNANNVFSIDYLHTFSQKYEFLGQTTGDEFIKRIESILSYLDDKTTLCLILGSEYSFKGAYPLEYDDRHLFHKELNDRVKELVEKNQKLTYIDINEIVSSSEDFTDNINHYTAKVYYNLAKRMISVIELYCPIKIHQYSSSFVYFDQIINYLKKNIKSLIGNKHDTKIYSMFRKVYLILNRKNKNKS